MRMRGISRSSAASTIARSGIEHDHALHRPAGRFTPATIEIRSVNLNAMF